MTPTTTAPVAPPPRSREDSAPVLREDPCVVLHGISWETYEALLAELTHSSPRLTYDEGSLQIMTPLFRHENYADALGRLVNILAEELDIDYKAAGSTTFKRRRRKKDSRPIAVTTFSTSPRLRGSWKSTSRLIRRPISSSRWTSPAVRSTT